ncbi:MAG: PHP domain-containing protein [Eubacteriales bacterium]|nr:PHP domain-containing protein [Eubacteriales bacterium]
MYELFYDLHIHSCLSPCGDDSATPASIAGFAKLNGLDVIALTDHNTCRNCKAFIKACEFYDIIGICGMELTVEEDFHIICLFYDLNSALSFDSYVYEHLIKVKNIEKYYGNQLIVDCDDNIISKEENLLILSTNISYEEVYDLVKNYNGICFPAHIEKESTSLLSVLGLIPLNSKFNTYEIMSMNNLHKIKEKNKILNGKIILQNSDAHNLENIHKKEFSLISKEKNVKSILDYLK